MSRLTAILDNITTQAKIALLGGVIFFISALTKVDYSRINLGTILGLLAIFGGMVVATYAVDCYSKGQCETLAWVASSYLFIASILLVIR